MGDRSRLGSARLAVGSEQRRYRTTPARVVTERPRPCTFCYTLANAGETRKTGGPGAAIRRAPEPPCIGSFEANQGQIQMRVSMVVLPSSC